MIELQNVNKSYGNVPVLKNFSLVLEECGIYCLLGRNGAGKTTLLKAIAGHHNINGGRILLDGKKIDTASMETGVTYIESIAKHFNMPVKKLIYLAYELSPAFDYEFALEMLERFELDGNKKFKNLSLGMKTMVSMIMCLSSEKKVILMDEPALGLDAVMRAEFYELLLESFQRHPRIIIVSTHIIDEVSKIVSKLVIIDKGALKFYDSIDVIDEKSYSISGPKEKAEKAAEGLNIIGEEESGGFVKKYIFDKRIKAEDGITVKSVGMQDFFVQLVGNKGGRK